MTSLKKTRQQIYMQNNNPNKHKLENYITDFIQSDKNQQEQTDKSVILVTDYCLKYGLENTTDDLQEIFIDYIDKSKQLYTHDDENNNNNGNICHNNSNVSLKTVFNDIIQGRGIIQSQAPNKLDNKMLFNQDDITSMEHIPDNQQNPVLKSLSEAVKTNITIPNATKDALDREQNKELYEKFERELKNNNNKNNVHRRRQTSILSKLIVEEPSPITTTDLNDNHQQDTIITNNDTHHHQEQDDKGLPILLTTNNHDTTTNDDDHQQLQSQLLIVQEKRDLIDKIDSQMEELINKQQYPLIKLPESFIDSIDILIQVNHNSDKLKQQQPPQPTIETKQYIDLFIDESLSTIIFTYRDSDRIRNNTIISTYKYLQLPTSGHSKDRYIEYQIHLLTTPVLHDISNKLHILINDGFNAPNDKSMVIKANMTNDQLHMTISNITETLIIDTESYQQAKTNVNKLIQTIMSNITTNNNDPYKIMTTLYNHHTNNNLTKIIMATNTDIINYMQNNNNNQQYINLSWTKVRDYFNLLNTTEITTIKLFDSDNQDYYEQPYYLFVKHDSIICPYRLLFPSEYVYYDARDKYVEVNFNTVNTTLLENIVEQLSQAVIPLLQ